MTSKTKQIPKKNHLAIKVKWFFLFCLLNALLLTASGQSISTGRVDTLRVFEKGANLPLSGVYCLNPASKLVGVSDSAGYIYYNSDLYKFVTLQFVGKAKMTVLPFSGLQEVYLQDENEVLEEAIISINRSRFLDTIVPEDFLISGEYILILDRHIVYYMHIDDWKIASILKLNEEYQEITKDCKGNMFLISKTKATHIGLRQEELTLFSDYTLQDYYNKIAVCSQILNDTTVLINYTSNLGFRKTIAHLNPNNNIAAVLYVSFNKNYYLEYVRKDRIIKRSNSSGKTKVHAKSLAELKDANSIFNFKSDLKNYAKKKPNLLVVKNTRNTFILYDSYNDSLITYSLEEGFSSKYSANNVMGDKSYAVAEIFQNCEKNSLYFIIVDNIGCSLYNFRNGSSHLVEKYSDVFNQKIRVSCKGVFYFQNRSTGFHLVRKNLKGSSH